MKKLRLASKVNPPTNALRHSYASYWLARSSKEGLGELVLVQTVERPGIMR
jgi:hypothetical protein